MDALHQLPLLTYLTMGLSVALVLGFATHKIGLSPIVGYILAGIVVGPHTPGFVADAPFANELAEIGVILLMFGVGLHFSLKDLLSVRFVAIPGAIFQSLVATALGAFVAYLFGWGLMAGLVLGMALSVASTVMLVRMLSDNSLLSTPQGHIAIGWLVVEDIFTILLLVILPCLASGSDGQQPALLNLFMEIGWATLKLFALGALILYLGAKLIPWLMGKVAGTRSTELFTLTALVVALSIAMGSAYAFGVSLALGAFLAGMVVGQSELGHQSAAGVLPMRDAFAVLFFVAVGMLFDPATVMANPGMLVSVLLIVLIGKPLAAIGIVAALGYSARTALTVAIGLAQIGEFSFILAELARSLKLLPGEGHSLLVAEALISLAINPLLFKALGPLERLVASNPKLWRLLNSRSDRLAKESLLALAEAKGGEAKTEAIVVGYGPVGATMAHILADAKIPTVVVDMNIETVSRLNKRGLRAIYGDASQRELLIAAGVKDASILVATPPDSNAVIAIAGMARNLNPKLKILVRSHFVSEREILECAGASKVCCEEAEAVVGLSELLLRELGFDEKSVARKAASVRAALESRTGSHSIPY